MGQNDYFENQELEAWQARREEETAHRERVQPMGPWVSTVRRYEAALREITKREGRFSRDPLEHASNTIEDMAAIADAALSNDTND